MPNISSTTTPHLYTFTNVERISFPSFYLIACIYLVCTGSSLLAGKGL